MGTSEDIHYAYLVNSFVCFIITSCGLPCSKSLTIFVCLFCSTQISYFLLTYRGGIY